MSIPNNITKNDIIKVISEINEDHIPRNRLSKEYFLEYDNKILPPKFIISIANKNVNNIELDSNSFNAIEAKNFLIKLGFEIKVRPDDKPKFWIEKTIVKGREDRKNGSRALGKALWSPQKGQPNKKTGKQADVYKNMRLVQEGDFVMHLIDNMSLVGISVVKNAALKTNGVSGTGWEGPSYLIELEKFNKLYPEINREAFLNEDNRTILNSISSYSEVFYNSSLNLRQGAYLTPCPIDLLHLINSIYYNISSRNLPLVEAYLTKNASNEKLNIFNITNFHQSCTDSGLKYSKQLITRYISSLATKPFVLLSGLSGSGKTKLAEAFAMWICESEEQYALIPVGADWTNREPLLGYPNALKDNEYVKPDNDALDLLLRAKKDENRPYFLILDEMNLSHVERYFADFLSTMESKKSIPLHKMEEEVNNIPKEIKLPKNLFIVGTVNIDETTYMFSPKVLDRANTIEFRVSDTDISAFLENPKDIEFEKLNGKGSGMAANFIEIATATKNGKKTKEDYQLADSQDVINKFFVELQKSGAEFGYRTAFEISKLIYKLEEFGLTDENEKLDIAIMQKMLPKLHGSRTKLSRTLKPLAKLCLKDVNAKFDKEYFENIENIDFKKDKNIKYKLSFEKIMRMYKNAVENGFASYAEA